MIVYPFEDFKGRKIIRGSKVLYFEYGYNKTESFMTTGYVAKVNRVTVKIVPTKKDLCKSPVRYANRHAHQISKFQ